MSLLCFFLGRFLLEKSPLNNLWSGSLVGAYFVAGQLPYYGPEVYYDVLTSAGKEFIDAQVRVPIRKKGFDQTLLFLILCLCHLFRLFMLSIVW